MAIDVRTYYRGTLSGQGGAAGGRDSAGAARNSKIVVIGEVDITTYTAAGEPCTAADLGLESLDCILLQAVNVDGALAQGNVIHNINYDYTAQQILLWDGSAGTTEAGTSGVVRFAAFGDAAVPELT